MLHEEHDGLRQSGRICERNTGLLILKLPVPAFCLVLTFDALPCRQAGKIPKCLTRSSKQKS